MNAEHIVTLARGWLGTPYQHQGALKGVGCDCLGLLRGVWHELYGTLPDIPPYSPDWKETGGEPLLDAAHHYLAPVAQRAFRGGDVLVFRWKTGYAAKHCGIATSGNTMIHAHDGACVSEVVIGETWKRKVVGVFGFGSISNIIF